MSQKRGSIRNDSPVFNFITDDFTRSSLQTEKQFAESSTAAKTVVTPRSSRKTFRYMNRSTFRNPALPFRVDMSIVKESRRDHGSGGGMSQRFSPIAGRVQFAESQPKYETEIEVLNDAVMGAEPHSTKAGRCVRCVLRLSPKNWDCKGTKRHILVGADELIAHRA